MLQIVTCIDTFEQRVYRPVQLFFLEVIDK
jgi:hypothetical protein